MTTDRLESGPAPAAFPLLALACAIGLYPVAVTAADVSPQPDGRWHGAATLGGSFASGNASSQSLSLTGEAARARLQDRLAFEALLNYGIDRVDGVRVTTADQARAQGRYDYNLSEALFVFTGAGAETYDVAGVELRYELNAGAGYRLVRAPTLAFEVFAGLGHTRVDYSDGRSARGAELLFGEESNHALGDNATFRQRLVYRPGDGDLGDLLDFTATLIAKVAGSWTMNLGLTARWTSIVPEGRRSTDVLLTVGAGYTF